MTTFIIAGTSPSNLDSIEQMLYASGLKPANQSRREKLLPRQVSAKLLAAAGKSSQDTKILKQLTPGAVWKELVLDLMIANADQGSWGWADENAISLLDFWKAADHNIRFVLVYDAPASDVLAHGSGAKLTPEMLLQIEARWCAANAALLGFYNRNPDRCILVHGKQALLAQSDFFQLLSDRLGFVRNGAGLPFSLTPAPGSKRPLDLAALLVAQCTAFPYLYDEMQATATLPLLQAEETTVLDSFNENNKLHNEKQALLNERDALRQENELLIPQLHNVQEELEHHYLGGEKLRRAHEDAKRAHDEMKRTSDAILAENRVKAQLSYRLGATMLMHSKSISGWLSMPGALAAQARQFKHEQRLAGKSKPVSASVNLDRAEQVKQHLSYRLGATLIANSKTLGGWLGMPFALRREIVNFARSKKSSRA